MVTRAADYALRATLVLAGLPAGTRMCLSELAEECDVPPAFLYKVLRSLAKSGLLAPYRGITGGYELTSRAREATVLDVVDALDGLSPMNTCVIAGGCHRAPACPAHPIWQQAQACVRDVLASARIADLAGSTNSVLPLASRQARPASIYVTTREHPCAEHGTRRPASEGRRTRGTHPKRMGDR